MSRSLSDIEPLFIMGFGRSGTTLLRRVLNSYDDVFIWGEHHGYLRHVAEGFYRVFNSTVAMADPRPWYEQELDPMQPSAHAQAWINPLDRDGWITAHRRYLDSIFFPPRLHDRRFVGFKDTQYFYDDVDRTVDFLSLLFPNARFAFIVRHGLNSLASWYASDEELRRLSACARVSSRWASQTQRLAAIHESRLVDSYWITYEDLLRGEGGVRALLAGMDRELGDAQRAVLAAPAGASSSFTGGEPSAFNERWRTLPYAWKALAAVRMRKTLLRVGYPTLDGVVVRSVGHALSLLARLRTALRLARRRIRLGTAVSALTRRIGTEPSA
jgi:hypothetical protein